MLYWFKGCLREESPLKRELKLVMRKNIESVRSAFMLFCKELFDETSEGQETLQWTLTHAQFQPKFNSIRSLYGSQPFEAKRFKDTSPTLKAVIQNFYTQDFQDEYLELAVKVSRQVVQNYGNRWFSDLDAPPQFYIKDLSKNISVWSDERGVIRPGYMMGVEAPAAAAADTRPPFFPPPHPLLETPKEFKNSKTKKNLSLWGRSVFRKSQGRYTDTGFSPLGLSLIHISEPTRPY